MMENANMLSLAVQAAQEEFQNIQNMQSMMTNTRKRVAQPIVSITTLLLNRASANVCPPNEEIRLLTDLGLGKKDRLKFNRNWTLEQIYSFLYTTYNRVPLESVGFRFAKTGKDRRIEILQGINSVADIIKNLNQDILVLLPNRDLPVTTGSNGAVLPHTLERMTRQRQRRQTGALNNAPASSQSPGATDLANNTMPQQPGSVPRTTATVYPYNVNSSQMSSRQPTLYNQNMMYPQYQAKPQQTLISNNYPIHPDVRFRRLPFFDILGDLLKPSTLVPNSNQRLQEGSFFFHLTPQQATDIASSRDIRPGVKCDYLKQVQIRFCLMETTCEQEDYFPPNVTLKVNGKLAQLPNPIPTNKPGVEPKRPPKPVNVTSLVKLSPTVPNTITVTWGADYGRGYAITAALVHKLTSSDLLQRLKQKGAKHSDYTRGLIKEKLNDDDCEVATTCLRVSLMCPLGKMRMSNPCRPITCNHLQCFDAYLFLQMNERKPTWNCPVCDKPALYDNLVIDGYFQDVLTSPGLLSDTSEIQLLKDGSWSTQAEKKVIKPEKPPVDVSIEIIGDDVEFIEPDVTTAASSSTDKTLEKKEEGASTEVMDMITISDSDDDEPLAKRRAVNPKPDSTIKFSDTTSISSNSNQSRVTTTPGPSSVSSSGYPASPAIITLDSPSPPRSPQNQNQTSQGNSCMMTGSTNGTNQNQGSSNYNSREMPYLEIENDSNNGGGMSYLSF